VSSRGYEHFDYHELEIVCVKKPRCSLKVNFLPDKVNKNFVNSVPRPTGPVQSLATSVSAKPNTKPIDVASVVASLNNDLRETFHWSERNCLVVNASKSKALLVTMNPWMYRNLQVSVGGSKIDFESSVVNLGFAANEKLFWGENATCSSC
jgi:hypothetical protein